MEPHQQGGTVTIEHDPGDVDDFDHGEIKIQLLNDRVNGEKKETIVLTLVVATRGSEPIAVGRGGTEFGAVATVTVGDVPFTLNFSKTALSRFESAVKDTLTFFAQLSFKTTVDVTFDLNRLVASTLTSPANYTFATARGSVTPGSLTIKAGKTQDTVHIVLVDNGVVTSATKGKDSLQFNIINARVSSGDIWVGKAEATSATAADTVSIFVTDDAKKYGFAMSSDTVTLGAITTYNYVVSLTDTTSLLASPASADVTVNYAADVGSTAVAGVDYADVTGGSVTILVGESAAVISIRVLRVGEMTPPVLSLSVGTSTGDAEINGVGDNSTIKLKIK